MDSIIFFGFHSGAADYISHQSNGRVHDLYENETPVHPEGYLTDLFSQKAIDYIRQQHSKPFFLVINYNAPHWPWQGPNDKPYADSVNYRNGGSPIVYREMMRSLDEGIGSILKGLDEQHLSGNTIVIFTNDNGGERYSDNGGLAKGKGTLWEGGIRVPAFVRWIGKIDSGVVSDQIVTTMDWTATILSVGGANAHPDFPLDGLNLMPILMNKNNNITRTLYWRTFQRNQQKAIRMGKWKYLLDENGEHLFNLALDQNEEKNLKAKKQAVLKRLKIKYANWEKTVLQPFPLQNK